MEKRLAAFKFASELVAPLVEKHGIEKYQVGAMFSTSAVYSPVEQHITEILRVGDWLLEGDS